jgi:CHAT domain-containing protein
MTASPSELEPLNIAVECRKLEHALRSHIERGLVALEWLKGGTMDNLHNYLTQSKVQHNVFHFIGHGGFDRDDNQGFLAFADPNGRIDRVGGERLGPLLATGRRRFQLVVLNACEGARNSLEDPFSAVATSLLCQTGIPAAVAMQFEISDDAAIAFSSRFYAALAHGRPVDTAVTNARLAIYATHSDVEWATPVLYMRTPDGHLFNIE